MSEQTLHEEKYHIGETLFLKNEERLLDNAGKDIPLRAMSAKALALLASNAGRLVTKDDLIEKVWPGHAVTDESISQCITDIRRAIGDTDHTLLKTFPKKGYRLKVGEGSVQTPPARVSLPVKSISLVLLLLVIVFVVFDFGFEEPTIANPGSSNFLTLNPPAAPNLTAQSIAVLPFSAEGSDTGQSFFAEGFAEDLIVNLSEIAGLRVTSSATSFAVPSHRDDATSIAKSLNVRYLVDGSVRRFDDQIRISVQLIDGSSGTNIWAKRYDGKISEVFAFRDDVLGALTKALSLRLSPNEQQRFQHRGTENVAAFEALLRGRRAISHFSLTQSLNAERYFKQAIELDPNYALAHASLAHVYVIRLENHWTKSPLSDEERAFHYVNRALELDDRLASAEYTLGRLFSVIEHSDMSAAAKHLKRAIELQPYNEDARVYYAVIMDITGHSEASLSIFEAAIGGHPSPPFWYHFSYGHALFTLKRYAEASGPLGVCVEQSPTAPYCLRFQIANYAYLDRVEDAQWAAQEYEILGFDLSIQAIMKTPLEMDPDARAHYRNGLMKAGIPEK